MEDHQNKHADQEEEFIEVVHNSGGQYGHISRKLVFLTLWAASAAFSFGICGVCIGGILVQANFANKFQEAANINFITGVVSIYHAGGLGGVIASSYVSDKYGRKPCFMYNAVVYIIGCVLLVAAQNRGMLFAGRLFAGWACYGFIFSAQIYIMEQAPARSRGLLGTGGNGLALEMGFLVGGWLSVAYNYWAEKGSSWSWRFPFLLNLLPMVVLIGGYPFVPESPRWLISRGRVQEALEVLKVLHATAEDAEHKFASAEHHQIVQQYAIDQTLPSSWISMFTTYIRRSLTAILIFWGFLLGGAFFLATYGPQLFTAFGFSTHKGLVYQAATLTVALVNFIAMPMIDRVGRKIFLVGGLSGELVMLLILMLLTKYFGDGHDRAGANAFTAIFLLNEVVIAITEPSSYLMSAEIFPLHVRTKGTAIAYGTLSITNTWVIESAATMVQRLQWKAYLLFICITAVNIVMFVILLPETKNVPLEEMARLFGEKGQVAGYGEKPGEKSADSQVIETALA